VACAQLLDDAFDIAVEELAPHQEAQNTLPGGQPAGRLTLRLPTRRPDVAVPVIELFLQ